MTLPDLATVDDLQAILKQTLAGNDLTYGEALLGLASGKVRAECKQDITEVDTDTVSFPGTFDLEFHLPQRPVFSIDSITTDGQTVDPDGYTWRRDGTVRRVTGSWITDPGVLSTQGSPAYMGPAGSTTGPIFTAPSWFGPDTMLTVVYSHGVADVPGDLVELTARLAAMAFVQPVGVTREQIQGYSVHYSGMQAVPSMEFSPDDLRICRRYRRAAGSLNLRR